jgi:6,7-dimethyl-8-ribityllumazine synthase
MSTKSHVAAFDAAAVAGARVLVVEARFNGEIADALLAGARRTLDAAGVAVDVVSVPGALEIPAAIVFALESDAPYDGYVALGCVIRGETSHYDIVAGESARALMDLSINESLALGNGILTVENDAQAWDRADPARLDKGGGAASACLAMIALKRRFGGE